MPVSMARTTWRYSPTAAKDSPGTLPMPMQGMLVAKQVDDLVAEFEQTVARMAGLGLRLGHQACEMIDDQPTLRDQQPRSCYALEGDLS
jgi:hypothetical protein